jgi:biopolymer transport protein ExbB/TolQ
MTSKKLLYIGIAIFSLSILLGTLGVLWGFLDAFNSLRANETAGIGAVGDGIAKAIIFKIIAIVGAIIGLIVIVIGGFKSHQSSKSTEQMS